MNTLLKIGLTIGAFYIGSKVAENVIIAAEWDQTGFWDLRSASPLMTDLGAAAVGGTAAFVALKVAGMFLK